MSSKLKVTPSRPGYTLQAFAASSSPSDSVVVYMGSRPTSGLGTSHPNNKIYIPKTGRIRSVYLFFSNTGVLGSAETGTAEIVVNDTTATTVSTAITNDAVQTAFCNNNLNIPVSAGTGTTLGDYIEIKLTFPAWATNPTNVIPSAVVYIEA